MAADGTTLFDALDGLATFLSGLATEIGWMHEVCVTPFEPGADCDAIQVWPSAISTTHLGKCVAAPSVDIGWRIAQCIGVDVVQDCAWWAEGNRTETVLDVLWGMYGGVILAYIDGSLCDALGGVKCDDIRFQPLAPVISGDLAVWQGVIRVNLGVVALGS